MDKTASYVSDQKPPRCPACGSDKVVPIVYGYPPAHLFAEQEAGRIVLGGCVVTGHDPSWQCISCKAQISGEHTQVAGAGLYVQEADPRQLKRGSKPSSKDAKRKKRGGT
jgi:hypothetical protein